MKVVGIGGGTGLPVLLSGLKALRRSGQVDVEITAVVAVSDSGGSTGDLRRALGIPALGDLRNCFIALSNSRPELKSVCRHRFEGIEGMNGHSVGNVLLTALYQMSGDFDGMVRLGAELFELEDNVLPSTSMPVTLCAEYLDGTRVSGEANIPLKRQPIRRAWLEPENPLPFPGVLRAISEADAIVLGPGSMYTSIIPNLLAADVADAIHASSAIKIYACNLMTQTGETEAYTVAEHLRVLQSYLPARTIDVCLMNTRRASPEAEARYWKSSSRVVCGLPDEITRLGVMCCCADLLQESNNKIRHDGVELARRVVGLAEGRREWEVLCAES